MFFFFFFSINRRMIGNKKWALPIMFELVPEVYAVPNPFLNFFSFVYLEFPDSWPFSVAFIFIIVIIIDIAVIIFIIIIVVVLYYK